MTLHWETNAQHKQGLYRPDGSLSPDLLAPSRLIYEILTNLMEKYCSRQYIPTDRWFTTWVKCVVCFTPLDKNSQLCPKQFGQKKHTHPFYGLWTSSRITWLSQYQNQSGFYWVAVASAGPYANLHLPQTDNHASTPQLSIFTGWMPFLPPNQQRQSIECTQPFYGLLGFCPGLPGWVSIRKVKPIWIYWSKR